MEGIYSKSVLGRREIKKMNNICLFIKVVLFFFYIGGAQITYQRKFYGQLGNAKAYRDEKAFMFTKEVDIRSCLQIIHSTFA